nr:MAG TPA: hypothetical protein [Caudoviricetes sp.]
MLKNSCFLYRCYINICLKRPFYKGLRTFR